jgi:hypothetical protein
MVGGIGRWQRVCLVAATLDMLVIGVMVQRQFWEALPPWHHWIFFLLILVMMPLGGVSAAYLRRTSANDGVPVGVG